MVRVVLGQAFYFCTEYFGLPPVSIISPVSAPYFVEVLLLPEEMQTKAGLLPTKQCCFEYRWAVNRKVLPHCLKATKGIKFNGKPFSTSGNMSC